ncbi:MAG: transporter substrate-binding domain-containing protein [Puniceicoccales bacterium]|jgi:ABC-type amino acid transport substrate-binding protein|nr:transporter substrate-binding domain-containing protein [Puniceicoccales bacterium]
MDRKVLYFGLLYLISGINRVIADEPVETKEQGISFFKGITITQQHADVAKALADYMFSYKERHSENQTAPVKVEETKIEVTLPAVASKAVTRIGVLSDCFPFTSKQKDNFAGFEVDLVKLIAEEGKLSYTFQPIDVTEMGQKFRDKAIDIVLGAWLKDAVVEKNFEFSNGYLSTDLGAVVPKKHKGNTSEKLSFVDKKIGVLESTYLENYIRSACIQGAKIVTFNTTGAMLEALLDTQQRQLDLALIDKNTAQHWIAKNPELEYISLNMTKEYAFCVAQGSPLLKTINHGIGKVLGTQKFTDLKRRWSIGEN